MKLLRLFIAIVFIGFSGSVFAQFRKYSNEFLNIGAGARALGMGGAQIVSVSDGTAGYWNPAGLMFVKDNPNLAIMHAEYFAGIGKYDFGGLALPSKNGNKVLGISFMRFAVDDIPNTLYLVNPDGSVDYNNISTFSSADYAVLLSYSQLIKKTDKELLTVGGNVKIIRRQVGSFASAWGFGLDFGAMYHTNKWKFAAVLRDATTTFNAWSFTFTDREKEVLYLTKNDIPVKSTELTAPRLILGAGKDFKINDKLNLYAEANLHLTFDGKRNALVSSSILNIDPNIGIEAAYDKTIFVRAGISNFQQGLSDGDTTNQKKVWIYQPSLGAGFKLSNVGIDYAFTNLANQQNPLYTHVFSLKVDLVNNNINTKKKRK
ncbi:MAG: PorV/PorQ family protein [Chitinophagaceae bacterium]